MFTKLIFSSEAGNYTILFSGTVATARANFGQGTGPIYRSNLRCNGSEARLVDCSSVIGRTCTHREDAGVRCQVQTGTIYIKNEKC